MYSTANQREYKYQITDRDRGHMRGKKPEMEVPDEYPQALDASVLSEQAQRMQQFLLNRVIGQERAVKEFVHVYQQISIGMNKENRPAGVFLFTGPTGTGKTHLVKSVAEFLFGKANALTRIDCGEFQHSHEVSKLIGAPPGYVGYSESKAIRLSQENLDKFQTDKCKMNILLLDEIEEAHESLYSAILQILDAGRLTLGNGNETDFTQTIVVMTSNIGEKETQKMLSGGIIGLKPEADLVKTDEDVYKASKAAAAKHFMAKFINRIDRLIAFRSLAEESLQKILRIELDGIQERVWRGPIKMWEQGDKKSPVPIFRPVLKITDAAKEFLLKEGTSKIYGARELNRTLDRFIAFPLGSLIGSKQIAWDDIIEADYKEGDKDLVFSRIGKRDIEPIVPKAPSPAPVPPPINPDEDRRKKEMQNYIDAYKKMVNSTMGGSQSGGGAGGGGNPTPRKPVPGWGW